jgi:hypothetical protein
MVRGAVPVPPPSQVQRHDDAEPATIVLRTPNGDHAKGEVLHTAVERHQVEVCHDRPRLRQHLFAEPPRDAQHLDPAELAAHHGL